MHWGWAFRGGGTAGQVGQGPGGSLAIPNARQALPWAGCSVAGAGAGVAGVAGGPHLAFRVGGSSCEPAEARPACCGQGGPEASGGCRPWSLPSPRSRESRGGGGALSAPAAPALVAMATDGGLAGERRGRALYEAAQRLETSRGSFGGGGGSSGCQAEQAPQPRPPEWPNCPQGQR